MDNKEIMKAKRGQEIINVTALDRSSVGEKGATAVYADGSGEQSRRGGVDYLGHSLKGVSAVQENNGLKGTKGKVKYPSGD